MGSEAVNDTVTPPAGAGCESVTVAVPVSPPLREVGSSVTAETNGPDPIERVALATSPPKLAWIRQVVGPTVEDVETGN